MSAQAIQGLSHHNGRNWVSFRSAETVWPKEYGTLGRYPFRDWRSSLYPSGGTALTYGSFTSARDPDFLRLCRNSSSGCRRDHWLASLSRFSRHWMVTPSGCKAAAERTIQSPESVLRSVFISFRSSSNAARSCAKASFPSSSNRSSILRTLQHRAVRS